MTTQAPSPPPSNPTEFDDDLVPITDIEPDPALVNELKRRHAITPVTRGLLALVVAGGAFLGGVLVERSQAKTTSSTTLPAGVPTNIAALFGGARSSTTVAGAGGATTTGATQTFGTVKLVDGNNVYVSDAQGNVVKVATNATTKITVSQAASIAKLKPSTTVIVQGKTGTDGTVTAASISQTAAGGGLGGGGFPSFGGGAPPGAGAAG